MNIETLKNINPYDNHIKILEFSIAQNSILSISFDKENVLYHISKNGIDENKSIAEKELIFSSDDYAETDILVLYVYSDIKSIKLSGTVYNCTFLKNDELKEINVSGVQFKNRPIIDYTDNIQTLVIYDSNIETNISWFNAIANELTKAKNYRSIVINDDAPCLASESKIIEKNWFFGSKLRYTQIYPYVIKQFYTPSSKGTIIPERLCYYNNDSDLPTWTDDDGTVFKGYVIENKIDLNGVKDCNSSIYSSLLIESLSCKNRNLLRMDDPDGFDGNKIEIRLYDSQDNLIDVNGNISNTDVLLKMDKFISTIDNIGFNILSKTDSESEKNDSKFDYYNNIIPYYRSIIHFPKNVSYIKETIYMATSNSEYEFIENCDGHWMDYNGEKTYLGDKPLSIDAYNRNSRPIKLEYNDTIICGHNKYYNTVNESKVHLTDLDDGTYGNKLDSICIKINGYDDSESLLFINPEKYISLNGISYAKIGRDGNYIYFDDSYELNISSAEKCILTNVTTQNGPTITKSGEDFTSTSIYATFATNSNGNILRMKASYKYTDINDNEVSYSNKYVYFYIGDVYALIEGNFIEISKATRYFKQNNKNKYMCPRDILIDNHLFDESIIASGIDRLWVSADYGNNRTALVSDFYFDLTTKSVNDMEEYPIKNDFYNSFFRAKCIGKVLNFIDDDKFKFIVNNVRSVHNKPSKNHGSMCSYCVNGNGNSGIYGTAPKASVIGTNWGLDIDSFYELMFCDRLNSSKSDTISSNKKLYFDDGINMDFKFNKNAKGRFLKLGESYYLDKNVQTMKLSDGNMYIRDYINILEHMDMIYTLNNGNYVKYDGSFFDMNPTQTYYIRFYAIAEDSSGKIRIVKDDNGENTYTYMKFKICGSNSSDSYALYTYNYDNNEYIKITSDIMVSKYVQGNTYSINSRVFISDGTKYGGNIYKCTKNDNSSSPTTGNGWSYEKYVVAELYYLYCPGQTILKLNNTTLSYDEIYDCIAPIDAYSNSNGYGYITGKLSNNINLTKKHIKKCYDYGTAFALCATNTYDAIVDTGNKRQYQYTSTIGAAIYTHPNSNTYYPKTNYKISDVVLEEFSSTPVSFVMYDTIPTYNTFNTLLDNNAVFTSFNGKYEAAYKELSVGTSFATPRFAGAVLVFKNILRKKLGYEPSTDEVLNAMADNTISIGNDFVDGRGVLCVGSQNKNNGYTVF